MYTIATLYELQRHLGLRDIDAATAANLRQVLQKASHLIETLTQRRYCPYLESRKVTVDVKTPRELILPDDLLQLQAIRRGDGSSITLDDVRRVPDHPDLPASLLIATDGAAGFSGGTDAALTLTGVWGWHDRWTQAWSDIGDSVRDNPLSARATSISVDDADGIDDAAGAPRFQVGQLLRIDDEYLRLTAIDETNNLLTVLRGVQGSEPANHAGGAGIKTFSAVPAIRDLCLRYAALLVNSVGPLEEDASPVLRGLRRLTA